MPTPKAYYNEFDPFAAAWLRELIKEGLIADGDVDTRSIREVRGSDLAGYTQHHFFAGIGGWPYAFRLAGWPDNRPAWSGSCPCQPFSQAGQRKGEADERHLWPEFKRLIKECHPSVVFGEQVASADGRVWLAGVRTDLEALGYSVGAADLCAAGVSAPHIRQRLYWMADAASEQERHIRQSWLQPSCGDPVGLGDTNGYQQHWWSGPVQMGRNGIEGEVTRSGRKYFAQWRIKPGLSIVAPGIRNRVDRLRGAGNAIVPQLAAEFIQASIEAMRC